MFFFQENKVDTRANSKSDRSFSHVIEIICRQIARELPNCDCFLLSQQAKLLPVLETIYLSNTPRKYYLLEILKKDCNFFDCGENNVSDYLIEISCDREFLGYFYPLKEIYNQKKSFILLCDRKLSDLEKSRTIDRLVILQEHFKLRDGYSRQHRDYQQLEQLFYQTSHQLRNSLTEISCIAEKVYLDSANEFNRSQVKEIQNRINLLNLDISTFLQDCIGDSQESPKCYSKRDAEVCNLQSVWESSMINFQNLISQKKLKVIYPQQSISVNTNKFKLKQIFDNLLSNAIYFSPPEANVHCYWKAFQSEILISISDRGCGFSIKDKKHMFEPFYSRRKNRQGLGLTIVKKLIEELQGNIWAENVVLGGAKVSFILPKEI